MAIVVVKIIHDGLLEFVDALEDAATDAFSGRRPRAASGAVRESILRRLGFRDRKTDIALRLVLI